MLSRRSMLGGLATSAAFSGLALAQGGGEAAADTYVNQVEGYGRLLHDPKGMLDLPPGFSYRVISQAGETMSDGLLVPTKADGMGCFAAGGDRVALVRNHEVGPNDFDFGAFGLNGRLATRGNTARVYDFHRSGVPMAGGTTTLIYDVKQQRIVSQHLSLAGTIVNCAGGVTPWGSWISCEETVVRRGEMAGKDHGWCFEVPALTGRAEPIPLRALGRFNHEAVCVDPRTGIVYLTEDVADSLFYRLLPNQPGKLAAGGRLQVLGLVGTPNGGDTRNWDGATDWAMGDWKNVVWIDLDGIDNPDNDLRLRGHAKGGAIFARGEGVFFGKGELYFTCTSGGAAKCGQIMRYVPSPAEGQAGEKDQPGRLQLFIESDNAKVMNYADNIAVTPWGDVVACEDGSGPGRPNHLKGMTPDGKVYTFGRNAFRGDSEFAGVCFAPDGQTMFVNIQTPGITLAITGPWNSFKA